MNCVYRSGVSKNISRLSIYLSILAILAVFPSEAYAAAGFTPGNFDVDQISGTAEYTVPIKTPVGINGIEPDLGLKYKHNSGNGLLGVGWSLTGIQAITRGSTNLMRDGYLDPVDFDATDRFELNGDTLICISGTYGANGAEYRTEREGFSKIVSYGAAGSGPAYFKVWTTGGKVLTFGYTSDSRIEAQGGSDVAVWALNCMEDLSCNRLDVSYYEDTTNGYFWPVQMDYAYTSGTPHCSVVFEYEERDDINMVNIGASLAKITKRLSDIKTYVGSTLVLNYNLSYEYGGAAQRSRLLSVTECDGSGDCLPATTFTWETNEIGFDEGQIWIDAAEMQDICDDPGYIKVGDFNGDGKDDWLGFKFYGSVFCGYQKVVVFLSNGSDFIRQDNWSNHEINQLEVVVIGDFNGDGLTDFLFDELVGGGLWPQRIWSLGISKGSEFNIHEGVNIDNDGSWLAGDFNGDGMTDLIRNYSSQDKLYLSNGHGFDGPFDIGFDIHYPQIGDVDGDGMDDIFDSWGRNVYVSNGNGFELGSGFKQSLHGYNIGPSFIFRDFNGDGKCDLFAQGPYTGTKIFLSTGIIFEYLSDFDYSSELNGLGNHSRSGHFNVDGINDFIRGGNSSFYGFRVYGYIWNGYGYEKYFLSNSEIDVTFHGTLVGDFDGDGKTDVCNGYYHDQKKVYLNKDTDKEDVITTITNGLDKEILITYKPLTDSSVYEKGTDAEYPIQDYQGPRYVVSEYSVSNGLGGYGTYSYFYADVKIDKLRKAFEGFGQVIVHDHQTGIDTTSAYLQTFPFTGLLKYRDVTLAGSLVRSFTNTYKAKCYENGAYQGELSEDFNYEDIFAVPGATYFPYLESKTKDDYYLSTSASPVLSSTETYTYYNDGPLHTKDVTVTTSDNTTHSESSEIQYHSTTNNLWLISQKTQTAGGETRTTTFPMYDFAKGLLLQKIAEPGGSQQVKLITDYVYDSMGKPTSITDTGHNGSVNESRMTGFSYGYTSEYYTVTRVNALGHLEVFNYDWRTGQEITHIGPNGLVTDTFYDGFGRIESMVRADGTTVNHTYAMGGSAPGSAYNLLVEETVMPPVTVYYDELNREIYRKSKGFSGSDVVKYTIYNEYGWTDAVSRFHYLGDSPQETSFVYDMLGRVTSQVAFNTGTTIYDYNIEGGNNVSATNDKNQVTTKIMNAKGLLAEAIDDIGNSATYTYDGFGNLTGVLDSAGNTTTIGYDIRGRKTSMTDPDMGTWAYTYNAFSDMVAQVDARSQAVSMTFDKLSRVKTKSSGALSYAWTYDNAANGTGMLSKVTGPSDLQKDFTYDCLCRPEDVMTKVDGATYTVTTSYDDYSRVNRIDYPTAEGSRFGVSYVYTTYSYLSQAKNAANGFVYWQADERNALGQMIRESFHPSQSGLTTINNYDQSNGRLKDINTYNGSYVQSLSYDYDSLGNVNWRRNNMKNKQEYFTYDSLNRLTNVSGPQTKAYTYNAIGNMTSKSDNGGAYAYAGPRPHAVTNAGSVSYYYDAGGNMTGDSTGRSIVYNGFNRPVSISKTGASATFTYDEADEMVKQYLVEGSTSTATVYIADLYEKVTTGTVTEHNHYILADGSKIGIHTKMSNSTSYTRYMHKDHLGSTDTITNESGAIVSPLSYDAFGKRRNADTWNDQPGVTCAETDYGFTGHLHLDTFKLIHMKGRIYDPFLGRFISPDPFVQSLVNTQALNRYSYCMNNPLRYIDPTGFLFEGWGDSISSGASSLGNSISSGMSSLGNSIGSGLDTAGDALGAVVDAVTDTSLDSIEGYGGTSFDTNTSNDDSTYDGDSSDINDQNNNQTGDQDTTETDIQTPELQDDQPGEIIVAMSDEAQEFLSHFPIFDNAVNIGNQMNQHTTNTEAYIENGDYGNDATEALNNANQQIQENINQEAIEMIEDYQDVNTIIDGAGALYQWHNILGK